MTVLEVEYAASLDFGGISTDTVSLGHQARISPNCIGTSPALRGGISNRHNAGLCGV